MGIRTAASRLELALLCLLFGCREELTYARKTQLLVVVHSDLGEELAEIEMQASTPDGEMVSDSLRYAVHGGHRLPQSFAIIPRSGTTHQELLIVVRAFDTARKPLTESRLLTRFVPGRTVAVTVGLWAACREYECSAPRTCVAEQDGSARCAVIPVVTPLEVAPGDELGPLSPPQYQDPVEATPLSPAFDASAQDLDASAYALDAAFEAAVMAMPAPKTPSDADSIFMDEDAASRGDGGGADALIEPGPLFVDGGSGDSAVFNAAGNPPPPAPRCDDSLKNGLETDLDCGGESSCARCGPGRACARGADCLSGICSSSQCTTPAYVWRTSEFGTCNALTCGVGTQSRTVRCERADGLAVAESFCASPRPAESRTCQNTGGCTWYTGGYGQCNVRCGGGSAVRPVYCRDAAGAQVPNAWCPQPPPLSSMSCNTHACVVYVAGEPSAAMGPCWGGTACLGGYPAYPPCPAGYEPTRSEQACGNPNACGSSWALCTFQQVHHYGCAAANSVMGVSSRECTFR